MSSRTEDADSTQLPLGMRRRPALVGVAAGAAMMLSSCVSLGDEPAEPTEGGGEQTENGEETEPADETFDSIADFCASDPVVPAEDQDLVLQGGAVLSGEDPEEVPMPYVDQLDQDEDFVPADENGPAENVPQPVPSALLCDPDEDGASAALSYWFEAYWYGELTGDTAPLEELYGDDCATCDDYIDDIGELRNDDQWLVADPMTGELYMWTYDADPDAPLGLVEVDVPGYVVYDETGELDSAEDSVTDEMSMEFSYDEDRGHWRLTDKYEAMIGTGDDFDDDDFDDDDNGDDDIPEPPEDVDAPELPSEAEDPTPEGALATMEFWVEAFDYVRLTGDADPIQEVEHPDFADDLGLFYESTEELHDEGAWIELHGESSFEDAEVYMGVTNEDLDLEVALLYGTIVEAGWDAYDDSGYLGQNEGLEGEEVTYALTYNEDAGHWQLAYAMPESIDEILDDPGEPDLEQ